MSGLNPNNPEENNGGGGIGGNEELRILEVPVRTQPGRSRYSDLLPKISRVAIPPVLRHAAHHGYHRILQALRYEGEVGTKFLMLPVSFGIGALIYFSLPREPLLAALVIAVGLCAILANRNFGSLAGNIAMVAVFLFGGLTAGKLRSDMLATTMIERQITVRLTGLVLNREARPNGRQRYTIAVSSFEKSARAVPGKVRLTALAKYDRIAIGQTISGLALLRPPSGPAYPGSYDFAFQSWFKGIGANGFFLGAPKSAGEISDRSIRTRISLAISATRAAIGDRIRQALPGESGNLAAALIVGDRSGISEETSEALRQSGLAHILAISGLHMALVTATIILLVRGSRLGKETSAQGGTVVVFDDVTMLNQAQREAAWAEVARRLAHEVKNPLTPIRLAAERLRMKLKDKLEAEDGHMLDRATGTIVSQVEALRSLVDAFGDYARDPQLERAPLALDDLVRDVVALYQHKDQRIQFHLELVAGPPDLAADGGQIRQLLHNLIANSSEAMAKGQQAEVHIRTQIVSKAGRQWLQMEISDRGPGYPELVLEKPFEPYVTFKAGGSGLGLAICRKIINDHDGRISLSNPAAGGASTIISLPLG